MSPIGGQSIDEVARSEIRGLRSGLVLAVTQNGQITFLEAYGRAGPEAEDLLNPDQAFAFPAFSEVLLGALAQAMADVGALDLNAPLSTYLPLLSPKLGRIRLFQLLDHSGGLDDAQLLEEQTWEQALDQLNDRAVFTEPGFIHSRSRYSFPLLLRVVEKAAEASFRDLVTQAILDPLEMNRSTFDLEEARGLGLVSGLAPNTDASSPYRKVLPAEVLDGLPVLFTTATDVLRFLTSWMSGGIRGTTPWSNPSLEAVASLPGDTGFRSGVWVQEDQGQVSVRRTATGLGMGVAFHFFPSATTAVISMGVGSSPPRTMALAVERIADAIRPANENPDEALDRAVAALGLEEAREGKDSIGAQATEQKIPYHPKGWVGMYVNGEYKVELRGSEGGGLIYFTGDDELPVTPGTEGAMTAIRDDGRVRIAFRLETDSAGRRYVRLGNKAFLHSEDAGI